MSVLSECESSPVKLVNLCFFRNQVFSLFTIDSVTHAERLVYVVEHLLLSLLVGPLLHVVVFTMDFLKVRVHLLVLLQCHCFIGQNGLLLGLLGYFVLKLDLARDILCALFTAIITIHDGDEAFRVRSCHITSDWIPITFFLGHDLVR